MSRIDELKKQYPELNMTMFDLLNRMDTSKTYKYMPLLCKMFGERFDAFKQYGLENNKSKIESAKNDLINGLSHRGISYENASLSELYALYQFTEFYNNEMFSTLKEFMERMDKNQISNKDVTSYPNLDSLRAAVSLAALKEFDKELESQVIKEYEDDKWLVVRPLTFQSSVKYGASTRWCTTYQKEKQYFAKYWKRGILVYFINKETGYKFAGYKGLDGDSELSFWNAADSRVDYLDVQADDYLFPIVKRILSSTKTNKDFCSEDLAYSVLKECEYYELKAEIEQPREIGIDEPTMEMRGEDEGPMEMREAVQELHTLRRFVNRQVNEAQELGEVMEERLQGAIQNIERIYVEEPQSEVMEMEVQSERITPRNWDSELPTMRA